MGDKNQQLEETAERLGACQHGCGRLEKSLAEAGDKIAHQAHELEKLQSSL